MDNYRNPTTEKPSEAGRGKKRIEKSGFKPSNKKEPLIKFGWRPSRPGWIGRMITGIDIFFLSLAIIPIFVVYAAYHHFAQDLPSIGSLKKDYRPPVVSYFYSSEGRIIGEFADEYRIVTPLDRIPDHVLKAFLAAEDSNFYNHPGVDLLGIIRAFLRNREAGRIVQGGSTITQQVTKTFLLSNEKSYRRKIREAILAYRLEQELSKDEILFLYLNQIYLGMGAYGIEAAAREYFNKPSSDLTLGEAAFIAGLAKAPSRYSRSGKEREAIKRREYVLKRMVEESFIKEKEALRASAEELKFVNRRHGMDPTPQFAEHVRRIIEEKLGRDVLYRQGIKVYTTISIEMQQAARKAVDRGINEISVRTGYKGPTKRSYEKNSNEAADIDLIPEDGRVYEAVINRVDKNEIYIRVGKRDYFINKSSLGWAGGKSRIKKWFNEGDIVLVRFHDNGTQKNFVLLSETDIQASLVCMESKSGHVKAMVGGRSFESSQFNRAVQALRQPGSAFKPFIYAAAIDSGFTPADIIWDEPVEYEDGGKIWNPQNYDRVYNGPTTLYEGLVKSRNVVAVRLTEKLGVSKVISYASRMGIRSSLKPYLSLALGSSEVTLMELVAAYSTFPNSGKKVRPVFISRIEDRDGQIIYKQESGKRQVLNKRTSFLVLDMLKGVVRMGTGSRAGKIGRPVAGKTGTSSDLADAWFIGFTPEYTTGVWIGKDKREKLGRKETGGRAAAPVFRYFMKQVLKNMPESDFKAPEGVIYADINPETGWFADQEADMRISMCFKKEKVGQSMNSEGGPDLGLLDALENDEDRSIWRVRVFNKDGKIFMLRERVVQDMLTVYPDPGQPALE